MPDPNPYTAVKKANKPKELANGMQNDPMVDAARLKRRKYVISECGEEEHPLIRLLP